LSAKIFDRKECREESIVFQQLALGCFLAGRFCFDVPVFCGGAQVRPGDAVVGCEDGVLVLPESRIDDVLYQLDDVEVCERDLGSAITRGASLEEIEAVLKRKKSLRPR